MNFNRLSTIEIILLGFTFGKSISSYLKYGLMTSLFVLALGLSIFFIRRLARSKAKRSEA